MPGDTILITCASVSIKSMPPIFRHTHLPACPSGADRRYQGHLMLILREIGLPLSLAGPFLYHL